MVPFIKLNPMLFNSFEYLLFLPLVLGLYYACPNKWRWISVFAASCFFYMQFVPAYIFILFFIILLDFTTAHIIWRSTGLTKRLWLIISLSSNILLLGVFKYAAFLLNNIFAFFQMVHFTNASAPAIDFILPIGLSFHTFQSMSYTMDVYRGQQKPETHLGYFANYVLFFPQMVAGPIERYKRLGVSLKAPQALSFESWRAALWLIGFGLCIKMVIADNLAPVVNQIYELEQPNIIQAWTAVLFFSVQIYADFFGYSTIAIGSAKLLGIEIMDNFKSPYRAASITEFWSRWHISLSTWFKEYVYIPLGGNKNRYGPWVISILAVFALSGFWHGASWTFIVWGLLHGIARITEGRQKPPRTIFFKRVIIFLIVSLFWIFFRAPDFKTAWVMCKACFGFTDNTIFTNYNLGLWFWFFLLWLIEWFLNDQRFDIRMLQVSVWKRWCVILAMVYCILAFGGTQALPFIYFQF
ncbi:MAG: MBOAT family O-acyltransferase [Bacteroidia bacterium]